MSIKSLLSPFAEKLYYLIPVPLRKSICFESMPDLSDNTRLVFDELVRLGYNKKYKMYWILNRPVDESKLPKIDNVKYIYRFASSASQLKSMYLIASSEILLCSNTMFRKHSPKQKYFYLAHGCALKKTKGVYSLPPLCENENVLTLSKYIGRYEAENLSCNPESMRPLGFPRNDWLFEKNFDLKKYFGEFDKYIYWLPTYRQHNNVNAVHSTISIPIIYNEDIAKKINNYAKNRNILIILKPHHAQDLSKIKKYNLTNLKFIDNEFVQNSGFTNYQLLGSCDALITDYSTVYYDFLLCDKPIGLCWDDFDDYQRMSGFAVDPYYVMAGGEKIYNADDFCEFIDRVADNNDVLKEKRNEIASVIHDYRDNKSTYRTVNFIENEFLK